MEDVFEKIINSKKLYSLLPQHKNTVVSENIEQINHSLLKIVCFLRVHGNNLNSFLKFLEKISMFDNLVMEITINFDKMDNSVEYKLSPEDKKMNFIASGRILFDNEKNILIHDSDFKTTSKIFKFKKFKNLIRQKMENEILQVFKIYDNYS